MPHVCLSPCFHFQNVYRKLLHQKFFTAFYAKKASRNICLSSRLCSSHTKEKDTELSILLGNATHIRDSYTNVSPHISSFIGRNLLLKKYHPLNFLKQKLVNYVYKRYLNRRGNPLFSIFDSLSPIVSVQQNFDSLLFPSDHPSRKQSDTYYINANFLLRTHTSAHQSELILSGLNNFLVIGDVYRRDQIDSTHYPVFHQAEGVRLFTGSEFQDIVHRTDGESAKLFENDTRRPYKQEHHTLEAVKFLENDLKLCLLGMAQDLFGKDIPYKWTDTYFPFTHPSWELEIFHEGIWLEVLGCGIIEQNILHNAGAGDKIGWAFGLGLERLAMKLYGIPDIRLFWSEDTGFLSQFEVDDLESPIKYKAISKYPQCINDISFWIPENYQPNDFFDLARTVGGDVIEQVHLVDEFFHPKHKKKSCCYRVVYRHMERTLTKEDVNKIHNLIERAAVEELGVTLR